MTPAMQDPPCAGKGARTITARAEMRRSAETCFS